MPQDGFIIDTHNGMSYDLTPIRQLGIKVNMNDSLDTLDLARSILPVGSVN